MIKPNWEAPHHIKAFTTTRQYGFSHYPFHYANLGIRSGDHQARVIENREKLKECQQMPSEPVWLTQTHSTTVVDASVNDNPFGDASVTRRIGQVLVILTADCVPILITNSAGTEVAAIHAGWRGLCNGIIEQTIATMHTTGHDCIAWIGPSICGHCFEVGEEVCQHFHQNYAYTPRYCFKQNKWHINLNRLAEHILRSTGVKAVSQSNLCTFEQKNLFYSYRRDGQTGRIGTFIWFE